MDELVRDVVIVGGGTAGWMTAAALANLLKGQYNIRLVESDEIGIVGVGEATIPHIATFNHILGIDEDEFVRATKGTFKLGIEFVNWGAIGDRYIHGFGKVGQEFNGLPFHHYWLRKAREGQVSPIEDFSINTAAPLQAKFMRARTDMPGSPLSEIVYAFHFDAGLYARFLRGYAEQRGVQRIEGKIVRVHQRPLDGFITEVELADGQRVGGDLFIDCSGIRALLIEQTLQTGYDDWTDCLPCDRAIAVPCASAGPLLPITRSTAHSAGWQWRIPLQHRTGNGHVYSSRFIGEDEATAILMSHLDGQALAAPRQIAYVPGRRKRVWNRNCLAIGLAAGFFEPIESTNIHLIQTAILRLLTMFPRKGFNAADIAEINTQAQQEYEAIRDFIVLHYKATERDDSAFWNYCRNMPIPDSLQHRMDLYRANARILRVGNELFGEPSWFQVMHGQRMRPEGHHPFADLLPPEVLNDFLRDVQRVVGKCVDVMPTHADFVAQHCQAKH